MSRRNDIIIHTWYTAITVFKCHSPYHQILSQSTCLHATVVNGHLPPINCAVFFLTCTFVCTYSTRGSRTRKVWYVLRHVVTWCHYVYIVSVSTLNTITLPLYMYCLIIHVVRFPAPSVYCYSLRIFLSHRIPCVVNLFSYCACSTGNQPARHIIMEIHVILMTAAIYLHRKYHTNRFGSLAAS